jgi:hypothetical protein
MSFVNMVWFIFFGKVASVAVNIRLLVALLLIMYFGFIARFYHVKDVYEAYKHDMDKTREHLDKVYIGWIFIS